MSEVPETAWAYLAGLVDGEGYFDIFLHSNPSYRRETKKGYAREFRLFVSNGSEELLETVRKNIGNIGTIMRHKYKEETTHRVDNYTLRFYQGNLRKILPNLIPHLILKKHVAELMLDMLNLVKKIRNAQLREVTLLQMHEEFKEACLKTPGNKYRKRRKQTAIRERMIGRDGKAKLDAFS